MLPERLRGRVLVVPVLLLSGREFDVCGQQMAEMCRLAAKSKGWSDKMLNTFVGCDHDHLREQRGLGAGTD